MRRFHRAFFLATLLIATGSSFAYSADQQTVLVGVALNVSDLEKSVAFYELLGMKAQDGRGEKPRRTRYMNINAKGGDFTHGGFPLHETPDPISPGNSYTHMLLVVSEVRALCGRLAAAGTPCEREPRVNANAGNAIMAIVRDPDGRRIELIEPAK